MINQSTPEFPFPEGRQTRIAEPNRDVIAKSVRLLERGLTIEKERGERVLHMGPEYRGHTSSSNGARELRVAIIYADQNPNQPTWSRHYYVVATDASTGEVLGQRVMQSELYNRAGSPWLQLNGRIDTKLRGGGVASLIERATGDFLQRQANTLGCEVNWHITNSNLEKLAQLRDELEQLQAETLLPEDTQARDTQIAALTELIRRQEVEQNAWQHLYRNVVGATKSAPKSDAAQRSTEPWESVFTRDTQYPTEFWNRRFTPISSSTREAVSITFTDVPHIATKTVATDEASPLLIEVNLDTGEENILEMPSSQARRERSLAQLEELLERLKAA